MSPYRALPIPSQASGFYGVNSSGTTVYGWGTMPKSATRTDIDRLNWKDPIPWLTSNPMQQQTNRTPKFNWLATPTVSAGAVNVSFSVSDPDGDAVAYDTYIFDSYGNYTGIRGTPSNAVTNGTTYYSFPANALTSLQTGSYKVRVNLFDPAQATTNQFSGTFSYAAASAPSMALSTTNVSASVSQYASTTGSFSVRNSGSGTVSYWVYSNSSWITVNQSSGSSTGSWNPVGLSFNTSGYAPQTLYGSVTIYPSKGSAQTVYVTLTVTGSSGSTTNITTMTALMDAMERSYGSYFPAGGRTQNTIYSNTQMFRAYNTGCMLYISGDTFAYYLGYGSWNYDTFSVWYSWMVR